MPRRLIDPTVVLRHGRPTRLRVRAPARSKVRWEIFADAGLRSGEGRGSHITLPGDLPIGTFRLAGKRPLAARRAPRGRDPSGRAGTGLPRRRAPTHVGAGGAALRRSLAAQLGSWRLFGSCRSDRACRRSRRGRIALNPLHALFDDRADEPSPYSPNSRQFLNPLYIDVDAVPEFPGLQAAGLAQEIAKLRQAELVQYRAVAAAKIRALELAYGVFRRAGSETRRREFDAFRRDRGEALSRFACFEWLRRRHAGPWQDWPKEWRCPDEQALARLREANTDAIEFFEYLQWIAASAARPLSRASARARPSDRPLPRHCGWRSA